MREQVSLIECQLDDMTGEALGFLLQQLIEKQDVLDAYYTSVQMKKNRPGTLLSVLCVNESTEVIERFILKNSTTFGVRTTKVERNILDRKMINYESPWGNIQLKVGILEDEVMKVTPEYDDVANLARTTEESFQQIYQKATEYAASWMKNENSRDGEKL